ncbi:DUF6542 domain-containing protein [Corynebacterium gottingense]|uniref:DUF6542 domain-containing protein n=1 Tax=Corynebacterium gottingense TaxID=2041036 RepID=UPI0038D17995
MSHVIRNTNAPSAPFQGLPTGSAIGIQFAALVTGALLCTMIGQIGWPLLACFAVGVILVTTVVEPKGLFLTVASAPIMFVFAILATGYVLSRSQIANGGTSSRAALLTVFYPLTEVFPALITITIGAIVIAVVRYKLVERQNRARARSESAERHRVAESNQRTSVQSRRARERTSSVSVQELLNRAKTEREKNPRPQRTRGGLNDNLYD